MIPFDGKNPKTSILAALAAGILATIGFVISGVGATRGQDAPKPRADSERIALLEAELNKLATRYDGLTQDLNNLAQFSPPVGTVMAYAGEWPKDAARLKEWEGRLGWMLCDGRALERSKYPELLKAIDERYGDVSLASGTAFKLPDYRGYFLRGVDASSLGQSAGRDKGGVRQCGMTQEFATALPSKQAFTTSTDGKHNYILKIVNDAVSNNGNEGKRVIDRPDLVAQGRFGLIPTEYSGEHAHSINSGGDAETRPINVAVYWIIKVKSE